MRSGRGAPRRHVRRAAPLPGPGGAAHDPKRIYEGGNRPCAGRGPPGRGGRGAKTALGPWGGGGRSQWFAAEGCRPRNVGEWCLRQYGQGKYVIGIRAARPRAGVPGKEGQQVAELQGYKACPATFHLAPSRPWWDVRKKFRGARTACFGRISEEADLTLAVAARRSRRQVRGTRGSLSQAIPGAAISYLTDS